MMPVSGKRKVNKQIVQEAAEWAEELDHSPLSDTDKQALADWLLRSPEHVHELMLAMTIYTAWEEADIAQGASLEKLLEASNPEIIPLMRQGMGDGSMHLAKPEPRKPVLSWRGVVGIAAAFVVAALGAHILGWSPSNMPFGWDSEKALIYQTDIGEQRSLVLDDGSVVHLNTRSEVAVNFTAKGRDIVLRQGEALFSVAPDAKRPFKVRVGGAVAQALGTVFNIYKQSGKTTVSVLEGKVAVSPEEKWGQKEQDIVLSVGQLAEVRQKGEPERPYIVATHAENMAAITSWRLRKLMFDRTPLSEIVTEYNRYNKTQIVIADEQLARIPFTGTFIADDPASLLGTLQLSGDVQVEKKQDGSIVVSKKTSSSIKG